MRQWLYPLFKSSSLINASSFHQCYYLDVFYLLDVLEDVDWAVLLELPEELIDRFF